MDAHYPTVNEPATPEYVLEVLRDQWHWECEFGEGDPDADLTMEMTVGEWRAAGNLSSWKGIGRAFNEWWDINYSDAEWRAALLPEGSRTLGDVCRLIAERAVRPVVQPARLFGSQCKSAGVFLTIRSLLSQAGANADRIAPSTPLHEFTRSYPEVFFGPVSWLAPGSMPKPRINDPIRDTGVWLLLAGVLCLIGSCAGQNWLVPVGITLFVIGLTTLGFISRFVKPSSVQLGELQTFRDLSLLIAERIDN